MATARLLPLFLALGAISHSFTASAQSLDSAPTMAETTTSTAANSRATTATSPEPSVSSVLNPPDRPWAARFSAELGTLGVISHTIQFGLRGTNIDYVSEGGQDNLSLYARLSAELEIAHHHNIVFLYQPLDLRTQTRLLRDWTANNILFPSGTAVDARYGFDFYRASYAYDLFGDEARELSFGVSVQLRNAAISFTSADGMIRTVNNNVGIVPALKARGRYTFRSGVFLGFEVDGSYANIPGLNGSDIPIEGALLDSSIRVGMRLIGATELFANVRYIGGGSRGTSKMPDPPGDGFTNNWLHTMALSLGATLR